MTASQQGNDAGAVEAGTTKVVTLRGDCGVVLGVQAPCPDGGSELVHCGCGAEVFVVEPGSRCGS